MIYVEVDDLPLLDSAASICRGSGRPQQFLKVFCLNKVQKVTPVYCHYYSNKNKLILLIKFWRPCHDPLKFSVFNFYGNPHRTRTCARLGIHGPKKLKKLYEVLKIRATLDFTTVSPKTGISS